MRRSQSPASCSLCSHLPGMSMGPNHAASEDPEPQLSPVENSASGQAGARQPWDRPLQAYEQPPVSETNRKTEHLSSKKARSQEPPAPHGNSRSEHTSRNTTHAQGRPNGTTAVREENRAGRQTAAPGQTEGAREQGWEHMSQTPVTRTPQGQYEGPSAKKEFKNKMISESERMQARAHECENLHGESVTPPQEQSPRWGLIS